VTRSFSDGVVIRYVRTSGFVDDVVIFYGGTYGGDATLVQHFRCNVVHANTPAAWYSVHGVVQFVTDVYCTHQHNLVDRPRSRALPRGKG